MRENSRRERLSDLPKALCLISMQPASPCGGQQCGNRAAGDMHLGSWVGWGISGHSKQQDKLSVLPKHQFYFRLNKVTHRFYMYTIIGILSRMQAAPGASKINLTGSRSAISGGIPDPQERMYILCRKHWLRHSLWMRK